MLTLRRMGGNRVSRLISRYGFKLKAKWKPVHPGCLQAKIVSAIFITLKSTNWNHEFHRHTTTQSPQNQHLERTLQSPNGSPRRMSPSRKAQCRFFFSGHHTLKTLISWCPSVNKKRQDPIKLSSCYVQGPRYLFFFLAWYTYTCCKIMPNIESTFSMCLCLSELLEYLLQSSVKEYQVVALSADLLVSINIDGYDRAT